MKKNVLLCLLVIISLGLVGCGGNSDSTEVEELEKQVKELQEQLDEQNNTSNQKETKENNDKNSKDGVVEIKDGDVFVATHEASEIEISWDTVDFQQEVYSKSDNMYASYFPDSENETYIVAKMNIKNLGGDIVNYSVLEDNKRDIVVTFDNKYNYIMQQLDVTSSVMSKYWKLDPLKSQEVYFVQLIPDEVIDKPYTISFTMDNTKYTYSK